MKLKVKVDQPLIEQHGHAVQEGMRCPIYHALVALGVDVLSVDYERFYYNDEYGRMRWSAFPPEADRWQHQQPSELQPISFEVEV